MPKVVDHEKYRDELLMKCFELFASRGYSSVTLREIARKLKVSTGSLYHYFPNKQAILQKMFEFIAVREIGQAFDFATQADNIDKRTDALFSYFKKREPLYHNIVKLLMDYSRHCTSEENIKFLNEYAKIIFKTIAKGARQDMAFGTYVMIFFFGLIYGRILVPDIIDFNEQVSIFKKMILMYIDENGEELQP